MCEPGAASIAADIWGVGALLYEMLAGRPPFQASSKDDMMIPVTTEPPLPLVRVPVDLAAVCFRCLEKDSARRYTNAGDTVTICVKLSRMRKNFCELVHDDVARPSE